MQRCGGEHEVDLVVRQVLMSGQRHDRRGLRLGAWRTAQRWWALKRALGDLLNRE